MEWSEVLADPSLQDLPYKIETNRYGQIVMSPASNEHGFFQIELGSALRSRRSGRTYSEASVQTTDGVKVADVAWCSDGFVTRHAGQNPFAAAPELCVEIVSPSNSRREIAEKRALYFEAGAQEVWVCDLKGQLAFYGPKGEVGDSTLSRVSHSRSVSHPRQTQCEPGSVSSRSEASTRVTPGADVARLALSRTLERANPPGSHLPPSQPTSPLFLLLG